MAMLAHHLSDDFQSWEDHRRPPHSLPSAHLTISWMWFNLLYEVATRDTSHFQGNHTWKHCLLLARSHTP